MTLPLPLLIPEGVEAIVAEPLRFKQKLHIGRAAYSILRAKDAAGLVVKTAGAAGLGGAVASSSTVATTFFAPTGIMAWLGLATATTPIGWVVAASVASGAAALGVMTLLGGDKKYVSEIPHFINTRLDVLATSLMNLVGRLAVRIAMADGHFASSERKAIIDHLVFDWGYDRLYAEKSIDLFAEHDSTLSIETISTFLNDFQSANPDCNNSQMKGELMRFVQEIIEADGVVRPEEIDAVAKVRAALDAPNALVVKSREIGESASRHGQDLVKASASAVGDLLVSLGTRLRDNSGQKP